MAAMRERLQWTSGDKVMIAVLSFAIFLALAFGVFAFVSIATHTYDPKDGLKAVVGFAIYGLTAIEHCENVLMG